MISARIYTITEMAEEFGATLRTLRFYEQRGLIRPQRRGAVRMYSEADRARLRKIFAMKRLGFTVREIAADRFPREKFADQLSIMRRQRDELDQVIAELEQRAAA